ncbi:hypothetical protein LC608_33725 [Nostoc sp. XA010]|uniref:hypothetical protein n=1 Tax=Nostoc sp. XA010 TaxID=2780407 RepID=UPI001E5A3EAA|nr:hypothetical protein [Nostoc sp. XA010]MCC5661820.1 hypothetical protein [Nostoc sp. XA010]
MKFYSALLAISVVAGSIMPTLPSFASFKSNLPQPVAATEQVNPPPSPAPEPEPVPHRGKGRR